MSIKRILNDLKMKAKNIVKKDKDFTLLTLANEYINQLEEYVFKILKDRDSILESWEIEVQKRKKLEKEVKELKLLNKRYENENSALKILVKEMYYELQRLESNSKIIDYKLKNKEEFIKHVSELESDQKLNQTLKEITEENTQVERLCELREKVKEAFKKAKLSELNHKNDNIFSIDYKV